MATSVGAEEREVLPITLTNLFIRHNQVVELATSFVQSDAASCYFCPLSSSVALISVLRSLSALFLLPRRPEHQGITGCRQNCRGREKRTAAMSHQGERKRRKPVRRTDQKTKNSGIVCTLGKILVWKFISHEDSCSPNCFGILKTFSTHPGVGA